MDLQSKIIAINRNILEGTTLSCVHEIIKERFFFGTLQGATPPESTGNTHYFTIDDELVYRKYTEDFGPLNLSMLYRYCQKVNGKLMEPSFQRIVHCTSSDPKKRVNAAFLVGAYLIIYQGMDPNEALSVVSGSSPSSPPFAQFRDAGYHHDATLISLLDILGGVYKAFKWKFFDFQDFDLAEYEHYEKLWNGGLNWVVPEKLIGFSNPLDRNGDLVHPPEIYLDYFNANGVKVVIRLNQKHYDASKFTSAGFLHEDMYFTDGTTPTDPILKRFLAIADDTQGALAIHCKAGLGRTGTLITCYMMSKFDFTAREAIGWLRICRPGSVIGSQQGWLEQNEAKLRQPMNRPIPGDHNMFKFPIYSIQKKHGTQFLGTKLANANGNGGVSGPLE